MEVRVAKHPVFMQMPLLILFFFLKEGGMCQERLSPLLCVPTVYGIGGYNSHGGGL